MHRVYTPSDGSSTTPSLNKPVFTHSIFCIYQPVSPLYLETCLFGFCWCLLKSVVKRVMTENSVHLNFQWRDWTDGPTGDDSPFTTGPGRKSCPKPPPGPTARNVFCLLRHQPWSKWVGSTVRWRRRTPPPYSSSIIHGPCHESRSGCIKSVRPG